MSPEPLHQLNENKEKGGKKRKGGTDERRRAESRQKIKRRDVKSRRMKSSVMKSRTDGRRGLREKNNTASLNHFAVFLFLAKFVKDLQRIEENSCRQLIILDVVCQ